MINIAVWYMPFILNAFQIHRRFMCNHFGMMRTRLSEWWEHAFRNDENTPFGMKSIIICKWWNDRHLRKSLRFITDLSVHFQMIAWPSFRNDRGTFLYDNPASSFRKQGGFTSYHHGENFIFYIIKKEGVQAEKKVIFKWKIIAWIFWNKVI